MNKQFWKNKYLKKCFFIIFIVYSFFLPITAQAVGDKGCCIKDTTKKTEDKNNCEQNATKINCSASNNFFIEDDPQCSTPIAMSYCGNPSKENDLGCCVKDTIDSKNFGSSNCQSNQKRSACSGKLFEVSEPDCSKNSSVSKYCNAENKQQAVSHDGLVPCGGPTDPCTLCHLIVGIGKLVDYGKNIVVTIAIVAIFIAGIMYMVSTGNEQMISKAKSFLGASLVGFAVVLAAWLIVDVTILWIANADPQLKIGVTSWHTFECDTSSSALSGSGKNVGIGDTPPQQGSGGNDAEIRKKLTDAGISINKPDCKTETDTDCTSLNQLPNSAVNGLLAIKEKCGSFTVTGGTEAGHASHGHGIPNVDINWNESVAKCISENPSLVSLECNVYRKYEVRCTFQEKNPPHMHIVF